MIREVVQAVRGGEYRTPKTILGFLGSLVAIAAATAVGMAFALSSVESLHFLIVGCVVFLMVLLCFFGGAVLLFAWKDPSKLQLGHITGTEYVAIQQQTRGDSEYGEYLELPQPQAEIHRSDEQSIDPPPALPAEGGAEDGE